MYVKAHNTPASAPGGHSWEDEGSVVEVPDHLGTELIRIAGQFSEVLPGDPEHPGDGEDLIGAPAKKPCAREGCKNSAKSGMDTCHWHRPKTEILE
jgi:hypothetical protein